MIVFSVPSKRILSLRDPTSKMSKSAPSPSSRILLTDSPSQIIQKLKQAMTDSIPGISFDPDTRPGVSNLLTIWSALDDRKRSSEELAREAREGGWGMGKLKETVGEVVIESLRPVREEYERMKGEEVWLRDVAAKGRERAREVAARTMGEVRRAVGLDHI